MEIDQGEPYQLGSEQKGRIESPTGDAQKVTEAVPGVPIVRSSTPRPLSFQSMIAMNEQIERLQPGESENRPIFPSQAPSAPPLPEELGGNSPQNNAEASSLQDKATHSTSESQEFVWLFEYGLEMDNALLNSAEYLDGQALVYGPAVLKGYELRFMRAQIALGVIQTVATIVVGSDPSSEVWGMLYRIPRRLTEQSQSEPSLLDAIHGAAKPKNLFRAVEAVVRETYREREVKCITYVVLEQTRYRLFPVVLTQDKDASLFVQRLISLAQQLKLPEGYLRQYALSASVQTNDEFYAEHKTDPLPILKERNALSIPAQEMPNGSRPSRYAGCWLVVFALYLLSTLLVLLTLIVLHTMGTLPIIPTPDFSPLGVPWQVLWCGLVGGCVSSIIWLGRARSFTPPTFVVIVWFARPFVGAFLAIVVYLFLNNGLFFSFKSGNQPSMALLLAGILAGLCEGLLFIRRKRG